MTKKTHPLARRLAARKTVALLTGSHASLGLADRMGNFEGYKTATAADLLNRQLTEPTNPDQHEDQSASNNQ